jgi:hypothetical protein
MNFGENAQLIVTNLQPLYTILHLVDKDGCTIGLLYDVLNMIGEALVITKNLSTHQCIR